MMKRSQARALLDAYARAAIEVSDLRQGDNQPLSPGRKADLDQAIRNRASLGRQLEDLLARVEMPVVHHASR